MNTGIGHTQDDILNLITGGATRLALDDNSRISLSNNDASGAVGTTLLGYNAGLSIVSGAINNTFIGHGVSDATMTNAADHNVGVGYISLGALTSGAQNTAVGSQSLLLNTEGNYNTAIGTDALGTNVDTDSNTAVGNAAGYNTKGAYNTYVGKSAGAGASGAEANNVGVGSNASGSLTTGQSNVGQVLFKILFCTIKKGARIRAPFYAIVRA